MSFDAGTSAGLLGDREFIVLHSRGGGYGPGTSRDGWTTPKVGSRMVSR
nr:hypothetical protein [Mycobacteroides abscessus]